MKGLVLALFCFIAVCVVRAVPVLDRCVGEVDVIPYTEGRAITICGSGFAPGGIPVKRAPDVLVTVGGVQCEVDTVADDEITCILPAGGGSNVPVTATVFGTTLHAHYTISYGAPVVTSVTPTIYTPGTRVTIHGRNLGGDSHWYNTKRTIVFGRFTCTGTQFNSGVLSCVLPANTKGSNLAVSFTVSGLSNDVYAAPVIDTNVAEDTLACSFPKGAIDATNFDACNCFSGFAPASGNDDCSVAASCPGQVLQPTHIGGSSPSRPHTAFANDKLTIVQTSPIVHGRRDVHISLVAQTTRSAETCNYPGSIWTKTVSSLDCLDVYTMVMPWSQNGLCGFENITGEIYYNTYSSTLVTVYRDILGSGSAKTVRSGTVSHLVVVKFQKQLTIALESASIAPVDYENGQIDVEILEDAMYDPATLNTLITFDTTTDAPYQLSALAGYWYNSADNVVVANGNVSITIALQSPQPGNLECGNWKNTCSQRWVMTIQTVNNGVAVCNLKGKIDLVPSTLCRDPEIAPATCPVSAPLLDNATIVFSERTDLCEESSDDVSASEGLDFSISTYEDALFSAPQNTFQPGDVAHFMVAVVDPAGTIDGLRFNKITIRTDNGDDDILLDVENLAFVPPPPQAHFNITSELVKGRDAPLAPGHTFIMTFRVTLTRLLDTLASLSGAEEAAALSVEIVADIEYHGNDKRTVVVENNLQKSATARIVIVGSGNEENDVQVAEEEEFSLFEDSAATTSFSFVAMLVMATLALFM